MPHTAELITKLIIPVFGNVQITDAVYAIAEGNSFVFIFNKKLNWTFWYLIIIEKSIVLLLDIDLTPLTSVDAAMEIVSWEQK